ncbi:ubiquitin-like activating enzyme [Grosmannia clavigera kw1407]|uniref:Ubiquitin-like activating enzyme n=1 Tax=Grosmannia clavigera (strain kw1407 / UAMH 11150) TaxID=655863 RepID=F0X7K9_GROCL|nr:ubiquitin-like activating enzyme [Grosmannia clavigera kw1407]EFX06220.1 ubiquitin-like activating enzyme [Grosmannia clavigera kw1407]
MATGSDAGPVVPGTATATLPAATAAAAPTTGGLGRDVHNSHALGRTLNAHVKQARVLMVGAGGIGCELLKTLVLTGFGEVHIVDLDTIDLSNLNRQFLFRHEHIKKSKALVARDAAQRFNPQVRLVAHHANIKDAQFDVAFFRGFRIVFNALDNLDARRHVNRMCLAADVPLVESGTTGFNGQVQVIRRGVTACYDCSPKEAPRSFPVCTIRSTPSQPIHCIVWAKSYLLNEMFGDSEDESAFDHSADAQNAAEIVELRKESFALKALRRAVGTPAFARRLSDKVFRADIDRLRSMEDMWKSRDPPQVLAYDDIVAATAAAGLGPNNPEAVAVLLRDGQKVWTLEESVVVFNDSIERLSRRVAQLREAGNADADALIEFDKDDIDTLDFVAASANIRSTLFGIEHRSRFDIKQMAGNIIPAIATTNAIVASLCVLQSFKVLQGDYDAVKEVFLTPFASDHLLAADQPRQPNPECPVCSSYQTSVRADLSKATLADVVELIVKTQLGFGDRDFVVSNDVGILYDVEETDNLEKQLSDLGVRPGSFLTVIDDEDEDPYVNVVINIEDSKGEPLPDGNPVVAVGLEGPPNIRRRPKKTTPPSPPPLAEANGTAKQNGKHALDIDDDDVVPLDGPAPKRPRVDDVVPASNGNGESAAKKKAKPGEDVPASNDDIINIEDVSNGAIVIDDD